MSETINAVINNLADRFGEIVEAVSPVVQKVGTISQTVVQETANCGFVYTMIGLGILTIGVACLAVLGVIIDKAKMQDTKGLLIIVAFVFTFVGFCVTLVNLSDWIAPTKQVIYKVVHAV